MLSASTPGTRGEGGRCCKRLPPCPHRRRLPCWPQHPPSPTPAAPPPNHHRHHTSRCRHLNAPALAASFCRPALLITDAAATSSQQPAEQRRRREDALIEALLATLRGGGSCLLPVDTAGRVLELLLLLDSYWGEHQWVAWGAG